MPPPLPAEVVARIVVETLREDLGERGDLTTGALLPGPRSASARFTARRGLVVAGLAPAREVFRQLDPGVRFQSEACDGDRVTAGTTVATARGDAGALLRGERSALNFLMRMSGIASSTRRCVDEVAGTGVIVLDTRKTGPGLRRLDKYAVAAGGGVNHRLGLDDGIMIKDTHRTAAGGIAAAVASVRAAGHPAGSVTVEVDSAAQLAEAIEAGAGRALLDNLSIDELRACAELGRGRIVLEASGGLRAGELRAVAETGVDCLSVGFLTHSVESADLAMDMDDSR